VLVGTIDNHDKCYFANFLTHIVFAIRYAWVYRLQFLISLQVQMLLFCLLMCTQLACKSVCFVDKRRCVSYLLHTYRVLYSLWAVSFQLWQKQMLLFHGCSWLKLTSMQKAVVDKSWQRGIEGPEQYLCRQ